MESNIFDEEGRSLEDLLIAQTRLKDLTISTGLKIFEAARKRNASKDRKKAAIFVVNWKYQHSHYPDLLGILEDLKVAKNIFQKRNYHVKIIENSADILTDVCDLMEKDAEFKECARDVLQFIYMGHGIHKASIQKLT